VKDSTFRSPLNKRILFSVGCKLFDRILVVIARVAILGFCTIDHYCHYFVFSFWDKFQCSGELCTQLSVLCLLQNSVRSLHEIGAHTLVEICVLVVECVDECFNSRVRSGTQCLLYLRS